MAHPVITIWFRLAGRFIRRHRRKTLATGGFIVIGTAVLVLFHGITTGINDTMVKNTTHLHVGHAFMQGSADGRPSDPPGWLEGIKAHPALARLLVRKRLTALAAHQGESTAVVVFGVEADAEREQTAVARRIIAGRYPQPGRAQILIGKACADTLGLSVGATLRLMTDPAATAKSYRVSGIFATGIEHFDAQFTYIADPHLDGTLAAAATTEYAFFFHPGVSIPKATAAIGQQLPPTWQLKRWDQLMPDLVQLIDLNEISMQIIMVLVVVLVGFGISNTFILTIVERYREFGILKAMGVTPHELTLLIFLESFLVCAGAALLGLLIGWGLTTGLGFVGIDLSAFTSHNRYFVVTGVVHPRLTYGGLLGPGLLVVLVSLISSYLPTRVAGRRVTAEILRFS